MARKHTTASVRTTKQTALQRVVTLAVSDLGMDVVVAIMSQLDGPLVSQVARGFSDREVRAVLRTLSAGNVGQSDGRLWGTRDEGAASGGLQLRMVTPGYKNLLAVFLRDGKEVYGVLVVGKPEGRVWTKREKTMIEAVSHTITDRLREASLFDHSVILARPWVLQNQPASRSASDASGSTTPTYTSPQVQERMATCLTAAQALVPFDRGWVTLYDPVAAALEVLVCLGGHAKELVPGHRLSLNDSVSGWVVRHRKPRLDHNLASTQGRFHDYKQLYRDRFQCVLVVPFFVRGRVAGTITLASQTASRYESAESASGTLAPVMTQLAQCFEDPALNLATASSPHVPPTQELPMPGISEPAIRRQERQSALNEVGSFLATEIREPMGYIRAQLEEVTGDGAIDADVKTRIESAMRDLVRTETLLNEILDFAKPLALDRRPCQVIPLIEEAFVLVETDLKVNRIDVTKEFPERLDQVRWDKEKVKHALLSILENALEAMSPEGKLRIAVSPKRGNFPEMVIHIHNDGVPIPHELSEKIFEPYFTTKRSGTGLGLAMVKKVVEEHEGHIAIQSGPEEGTLVTIRLPAMRPRAAYRRRIRPPRRRPA
ncbi:MAG: ATP-binding protein [Nitrospira sp.]|nr:ATP-binding protein [Nitrospira sp.]MDD9858873.1 ATP-binding protein [Nitrospira sp.]